MDVQRNIVARFKVFRYPHSYPLLQDSDFMAINVASQQQRNALRSECECPIFLSDFNQIWVLSTNFRKNFQISLKSAQWEPRRYTRPHRRKDMMKLICASRDYPKAPKNDPSVLSGIPTVGPAL